MLRPRRTLATALLALALMTLAPLLAPRPAHAHAQVARANPERNAAVAVAPARLTLRFTEPIEPRFSGIEVLDATSERVDSGDFRVEGADGKGASIGLGELPRGTYTVSWRNLSKVDGHTATGAYAFAVGEAQPPASLVPGDSSSESRNGVPLAPSTLVRVLNYLAMAVLVGALAFRPLVLLPALRSLGGALPLMDDRQGGAAEPGAKRPRGAGYDGSAPFAATRSTGAQVAEAVEAAVTARALAVARAAVALLVVGTVAMLLFQAIVASGGGVSLSALGGAVRDLLGTRYGLVWGARLGLNAVLLALLFQPSVPWRRGWPWGVGLLLGGAVLLSTSLGSHGAAAGREAVLPAALGDHALHVLLLGGATVLWLVSIQPAKPSLRAGWPWLVALALPPLVLLATNLLVALDWLHLLAMSLWVGGLVQLGLAIPRGLGVLRADERVALLRAVVPRFSRIALACVAALALSGAYAAVFHVREAAALTGSAYGLALLAKIALLLPLLALGAANLYLGSALLQRVGGRLGWASIAPSSRRFFGAVRVEVLLVALVLSATGVLTSLSPPATSASAEPAVAYTAARETADGAVTLVIDPAIAGSNSLEVLLEEGGEAVLDASKVVVRFRQPSGGIGESEAVARHVGNGRYTLYGPYLGVPGEWSVVVIARRPGRDDLRAEFTAPVAKPRFATKGGVRVELRASPRTPRAGEGAALGFAVTDVAGKALPGARVTATLLMPAHAHFEDVVLRALGSGRYETEAQLAMGGRWIAQVEVERPGRAGQRLNVEFEVAE